MKRIVCFGLVVIFIFVMSSVSVLAEEEIGLAPSSSSVDLITTISPTATLGPTDSPTKAPETAPPGNPADTPDVAPTITPSATSEPSKNSGLVKAKRAAKRELKNFLNLKNYDKKEKDLIKSLLCAANKDINECKSVKEVKEYVRFAKRVLRDIPKKDGVEFGFGNEIKFNKKIIKVKSGAYFRIKVRMSSAVVSTKSAKQLKWKINKKGKKVIKFVKKSAKLKGKLIAKVKALAKGRAKVMCSLPNGKKASCTIIVW